MEHGADPFSQALESLPVKHSSIGNRSNSFWRPLHLTGLFLGWLLLLLLAHPLQGANSDAEVKAAYLFNFAKFIDWPTTAFPQNDTPIVIGVLEDASFRQTVSDLIGTNRANARRVEIRQVSPSDPLQECHIIFIPKSSEKSTAQVLSAVKQTPVLTVSDVDHFATDGGMIGFVVVGSSLKLEINLAASQDSKLKISSKLLALAKVVKTDSRKEGR